MKLATYRDGSRDGHLVVVSRDLSQAHYATGIATRLQQVLDDWNFLAPQLEELSITLNHGRARHAFAFEPQKCMAPLPRPLLSALGQAWPAHGERLATLRGEAAAAEPPLRFLSPLWLGATEPVRLASEVMGIDFAAELIAICGDVAQGVTAEQALEGVRLLGLGSRWWLRQLDAGDAALCQPLASQAPLLVTPDELGEAWKGGRVLLPLQAMWNGRKIGQCECGSDMDSHFGQLIAQLARLRALPAGSLVAAGPVSNREASRGVATIADKRALEIAKDGSASTEYMKFGDSLRLEIKGRDGLSVFGAIDQDVVSLHEPVEPPAPEAEAA
ncbi:fumarylacetoacetate hydrolase family protein [Paucibacter sp. APW11]|uniref:Fumarylacetoacetate hydrolase family protein n=1 Tax=Roseateles aquae TaxID=3077235 RepID=A0ABU3PCS0_9BURK|nr:fumarylacetoacetate hydrolase family protein [Paucibacter sp. APW11]MDT9000110.1 fumarylacetoacetate hydrolase family protein [Paucibacter sp. APW11]